MLQSMWWQRVTHDRTVKKQQQVLVRTEITKILPTVWLKQQTFISLSSGAGKSQNKGPVDPVSGGNTSWFEDGHALLVSSPHQRTEVGNSPVSSCKGTNCIHQGSTFMT